MPINLDMALDTLANDPAASLDLAEIALLLARDEYSFLDVEGHLQELDAMAREVKPNLRGHLAHQVQALCRYLFHDMGFRGNERDYYDPRNSYFNQVLERRLGIPITLSAVMMAVGARAGLAIDGIGLPGHFVVRAQDDEQKILVDPFNGGRILSLADCEALVQKATGKDFEAGSLVLEPILLGPMVQRMLNNLKAIYVRSEDWGRAVRLIERLRQLNPYDVSLRRDLGISYVRYGQPGKAIDHLRAYVDAAPEGGDIEQVQQLLSNALRTVAQWN
jgi:regulator of sirC expression with transglutaminase-like and TPR domain